MVRIGLWGTFDLENFGDMLFPRIARMELGRRVPRLELRTWSPIGYVGRNRFEGGDEPAAPLGVFGEERLAELARELDVLVIGGGEIVHDRDWELAPHYGLEPQEMTRRQTHRFFVEGLGAREVDVPTAWHAVGIPHDPDGELAARLRGSLAHRAYVSVRDEGSRERLVTAGVDREVLVVPDSAFLIDRLLPLDALQDRVRRLREAGAYPPGEALVVQGSRSLVVNADAVAGQVARLCRDRDLVPVLVETGPIHGDGEFADAIAERLPDALRLPAEAGTEDLVAAIAWSTGFVGSSLHGNIVAAAYDRPSLMLNLAGQAKLQGAGRVLGAPERVVGDPAELADAFERVWAQGSIAARVDDLRRRVDEHFDRLGGLATSIEVDGGRPAPVVEGSTLDDERERYARATRALAARMAAQQAVFADRELDLRSWLDAATRESTEKDIRFTRLWRRLHEGDRHYAWHKDRADEAESLLARTQEEVAWLRGVLQEREELIEGQRPEIDRLQGEIDRLQEEIDRLKERESRWLLFRERVRGPKHADGSS